MGGLVGYVSISGASTGTLTISQCYATGNVRAFCTGSSLTTGGGLLGGGLNTIIKYSYAAGDVTVTKTGGSGSSSVSAGGIAGQLYNGKGGTVTALLECFSAGQVSVNGAVYRQNAGGILGLLYSQSSMVTLSKAAALGGKVTAAGPGPFAARLVGNTDESGEGNRTYNNFYANQEMLVGTGGTGAYVPGAVVTNPALIGGTLPNGANASLTWHFMNPSFWSSTLGFTAGIWNFDSVVSKGYPTLAGLGGQ
jgi:hypothetical protein